jgi:hypothetical protein
LLALLLALAPHLAQEPTGYDGYGDGQQRQQGTQGVAIGDVAAARAW